MILLIILSCKIVALHELSFSCWLQIAAHQNRIPGLRVVCSGWYTPGYLYLFRSARSPVIHQCWVEPKDNKRFGLLHWTNISTVCSSLALKLPEVISFLKLIIFMNRWLCRVVCEAEQAGLRHRHQLGRGSSPRQEIGGFRLLLRQRHRSRHPWTSEISSGKDYFAIFYFTTTAYQESFVQLSKTGQN